MTSLDEEIRRDREKKHHAQKGSKVTGYRYHRGQEGRQRHHHREHGHKRDYNDGWGRNERTHEDHHRHRDTPKCRLRLTNVHYSLGKEELRKLCEQYGEVKSCTIDWDRTGRSNETATVEYAREEDAERALDKLPGTEVEGKAFIVEKAQQQIRQFKRTGIKKDWRK